MLAKDLTIIGVDVLGNPNVRICQVDFAHTLWRDQDELFANGRSGEADHHLHTDISVDTVHEYIKLVKSSNWGTHSFPHRE